MRIALHWGGDCHERLAIGDGFKHFIRGAHAKLCSARSYLLLDGEIGPSRLNRDVEPLLFVVALHKGGIENAMLRLRIPVGLQGQLGPLRTSPGAMAACQRRAYEQGQKTASARETGLRHVGSPSRAGWARAYHAVTGCRQTSMR